MDCNSGLMEGVRYLASPNCDQRPAGEVPSLLVIHGISLPPGEYGGPWIDALFTNRLDPQVHPYFREIYQLQVSSHLLIRRDGEVVQYVPFSKRAWHAGVSSYCGRERCNDFSIGIELEGSDNEPYEEAQYRSLAACISALMVAYPELDADHITGHSDIAPGRKTDPGACFDWPLMHRLLAAQLENPVQSIDT